MPRGPSAEKDFGAFGAKRVRAELRTRLSREVPFSPRTMLSHRAGYEGVFWLF